MTSSSENEIELAKAYLDLWEHSNEIQYDELDRVAKIARKILAPEPVNSITIGVESYSSTHVLLRLLINQLFTNHLNFTNAEAEIFICSLLAGSDNVKLKPEGHPFYDFLKGGE